MANCLFLAEDDVHKKLDLDLDMAKFRQAMDIPAKFLEWRWLLSVHQMKVGGLSPARDIERWKLHGPDSDDLPSKQKKSSTELSGKRKAAPKPSKDKAAALQAKDVSPLRRKPRLPSAMIKSSSKEVLFAEKPQVRVAPSSSTRVKHLVGVDIKKIGGMQNIRDILLKSSTESSKPVICSTKTPTPSLVRLPRSREMLTFLIKVQVVYISQGMRIEPGRLLLYLRIACHLSNHEQSSM